MDRQAEYLIARNQIRRGQLTKNFVILLFILVILSAVLWYYEPTSTVANLPYCVVDLFQKDSTSNDSNNSLTGVYLARDMRPRMDPLPGPFDSYVMRFYPNGQVIYASIETHLHLQWRKISTWFYLGSMDHRVHHAVYKINGSQVELFATNESENAANGNWIGRYTYGEIVFENSTAIWKIAPETLIFRPINVEKCPFKNN